jgi:hypothetical protein
LIGQRREEKEKFQKIKYDILSCAIYFKTFGRRSDEVSMDKADCWLDRGLTIERGVVWVLPKMKLTFLIAGVGLLAFLWLTADWRVVVWLCDGC